VTCVRDEHGDCTVAGGGISPDWLVLLGRRIQVSASTIRRVFKALKIRAAPKRHTDTTWRQFLRTADPEPRDGRR
jgi:hypothetical protein